MSVEIRGLFRILKTRSAQDAAEVELEHFWGLVSLSSQVHFPGPPSASAGGPVTPALRQMALACLLYIIVTIIIIIIVCIVIIIISIIIISSSSSSSSSSRSSSSSSSSSSIIIVIIIIIIIIINSMYIYC